MEKKKKFTVWLDVKMHFSWTHLLKKRFILTLHEYGKSSSINKGESTQERHLD